jgi:hypothetical protein
MKRTWIVALVLGCRATMPTLPHSAPAWAADEAVWVDPAKNASSSSAELLTQRLVADGFRRGAPGEPGTLVIKAATNTGAGNFATAVELVRDGRRIDFFQLTSDQLPCWGSITGQESALKCAVSGIAERIEDSKPLAAEHQNSASRKPKLAGRLAVLDLRNETKDLAAKDVRYFTDVVRGAVLKLAPQLEVMTRENLMVLLQATGKDLASCEGECEVDTGRRIGADQIISGELVRIGTRYKMSLKLHETHDGRLLGAAVASGSTIDELDSSANQAVAQLLQ